MGQVFDQATTSIPSYELASFEVTLEINAKGGVRLVGSASGEVKGGLKLTFRRQAAG
jgi:hypothetical protein